MPGNFVAIDANFGCLNVIPAGTVFMVRCTACGDTREVSRKYLEEKAGSTAELKAIEARLKCACGEKAAKLLPGHYCVPHPVYDEKTRQWIRPIE